MIQCQKLEITICIRSQDVYMIHYEISGYQFYTQNPLHHYPHCTKQKCSSIYIATRCIAALDLYEYYSSISFSEVSSATSFQRQSKTVALAALLAFGKPSVVKSFTELLGHSFDSYIDINYIELVVCTFDCR